MNIDRPDIEVGDLITDPEDGSLGIVIDELPEVNKFKIYWYVKYFGVTKESYSMFFDMGYNQRYVKLN